MIGILAKERQEDSILLITNLKSVLHSSDLVQQNSFDKYAFSSRWSALNGSSRR